jgi:hypothetical protein
MFVKHPIGIWNTAASNVEKYNRIPAYDSIIASRA